MTITQEAIQSFLLDQVGYWNKGEYDRFIEAHRAVAPNGMSVTIPAGTPAKDGWDTLNALWTGQQSTTTLTFESVITSPNGEAAVLETISRTQGDSITETSSVHTYAFVDGRLDITYYLEPGDGSSGDNRLGVFLRRQVDAWNAGDRETLLDLYREVSGGNIFVEYPLGGGEVPAWPFLDLIWDQAQATTRLVIDHLAFGTSGEAAMVVGNHHTHEGSSDVNVSIEIYRLADDGLHIRYFSAAGSQS